MNQKVKIIQEGNLFYLQNSKGEYWMGPRLLKWEYPAEIGAYVPCWMTTSREAAEAQAALLEIPNSGLNAVIEHLDAAIVWHRQNHNDPHNIGNAVIAALTEVRTAIAKAVQ